MLSRTLSMIAFWLMPAAEDAAFFDQLVRRLAREHDAPLFEPHVTLHASDIAAETAIQVLRDVSLPEACELHVEGIDHSEKYTKTLFVQFRSAPELQQLSNGFRAGSNVDSNYELNPHLSLLYKQLPGDARAQLASSITMPFETVRFDRLLVIAGPDHTHGSSDVESWQTLAARQLARKAQTS